MTDLGYKQEELLGIISDKPGLTFLDLVKLGQRKDSITERALARLFLRAYIYKTDNLHYITHKGVAYLQSNNSD